MKKQLFKTLTFVTTLIVMACGLAGLAGFIDISWIDAGGVSIAVASAASVVQETVDTQNTAAASTDLLTNTIDKKISLIRPDKHPLDTIVRNIGIVVPVQSFKTEYYAVETRGIEDTVKTQFASTTSSNNALWKTHSLIVTNIHIWQVDDNGFIQGTTGSDGKEIVFHVIAKNATDYTLTIVTPNGTGDNAADLPLLVVGTKITRIGNSKAELDAQTSPFAVFPQKSYNYCQIHMAQVEEGLYAKLHSKEVQWNINDFRSEALYDMRRRMELSNLVGFKSMIYDSTGEDYKYMAGGIMRDISKALTYSSTELDTDTFIGWTKDIFTGNNGSDTRVLFAGSTLMESMSKVPTVQKQLTAENVMVKWGVRFNRIETNFGELLVKHHTTLTDLGYTTKGVVLDMANIEKHVLKSLETRSVDLIKSGQKLANADNISEAYCLVAKNPDTHAVIGLA